MLNIDTDIFTKLAEVYETKELKLKSQQVLKLLCERLDADYGKLLYLKDNKLYLWIVYDKESGFLNKENMNHPGLEVKQCSEQNTGNKSLVGHVAATKKMLIINNIENSEYKENFKSFYFEKNAIYSELISPVFSGGDVAWVLCLSSASINHFGQSEDETSFYEAIRRFISALLAESYDSVRKSILQTYDQAVEEAWRSRLEIGHTLTIIQFVEKIKRICDNLTINVYLKCPGNKNTYIRYGAFSQYNNELLQAVYPGNFEFDYKSNNWAVKEGYHSYDLYDHEQTVIGFLVAKEVDRSLSVFLRTLFKRCKADIESILEEERAIILSRLRKNLISLHKSESFFSPFERAKEIEEKIKTQCGYEFYHVWLIDEDNENIIRLSSDPEYFIVLGEDSNYLTKVMSIKAPIFKYNIPVCSDKIVFPELLPPKVTSWVGYPLVISGKTIGLISCFNKKNSLLTLQELPALEIGALLVTLENELKQAKKELFASRMADSHQLSTHLAAASARAQLLNLKIERDPAIKNTIYDRHIRNIYTFLNLAMRVFRLREREISNLSDFRPSREPVVKLIAETVSMVRSLVYSEDLDRKIEYETINGIGYYDYISMQEALIVVLMNAVKYSYPIAPIIVDYDENMKIISVSNIGIGIVESEEEFIFEQGHQGSNVTKSMALEIDRLSLAHKGIGLHVAKKMMARTGGDVYVYKKGKCFTKNDILRFKFNREIINDEDRTIFHLLLPKEA